MTKKTPKPATAGTNPNALQVARNETETAAAALARASLRPTIQAAVTLHGFNKSFGELSMNTLVDDLVHQCTLANKGDLSRAEAFLTAQAHTLDAIFNSLARRASLNMGEYINAAETYMRLALKAQSQCRATLETLATNQKSRTGGVRAASQHCPWTAASEQRAIASNERRLARAGIRKSAEQTIGATAWRTVGPRSDASSSRS